jgi:DNA-binding PadR family transcriptional regulator
LPSLIDSVVLALVIERPSYGYEINERFQRRFGGFLSASRTRVYDALRRLEGDEYVEVAGRSGTVGRPRVILKATRRGVEANSSWLVDGLQEDPERLELWSRLASLRRLDARLQVIDRFEDECSQEARQIAMPVCADDLLGDLVIEYRRRLVAAKLEWAAYARSRIRQRAESGEVER